MHLVILTPEKSLFDGQVKSVKVPGTSGQFEILNGHAAIVSSLVAGDVRIIDDKGQTKSYGIQKGFVEVLNQDVALLVQGVEEK